MSERIKSKVGVAIVAYLSRRYIIQYKRRRPSSSIHDSGLLAATLWDDAVWVTSDASADRKTLLSSHRPSCLAFWASKDKRFQPRGPLDVPSSSNVMITRALNAGTVVCSIA